MTIEEAKQKLTIFDIWARLELPGNPRNICKSPFREDKHASFSVSADGMLFNDFATGVCGDAVYFLQLATGLSRKDACRKFVEMAGGGHSPLPAIKRVTMPARPRQKPSFPAFERGTDAELRTLAELRKTSFHAVFLARGSKLLAFATLKGHRAYVITDESGVNAQARRLDGGLWEHIENKKAWTLPGSWASWPLGLDDKSKEYPAFMLCEGGPDLLTAFHFIGNEAAETTHFPITLAGASQRIHADALAMLAGKRIRIYGHTDNAGREAAARWTAQLEAVEAEVDCFNFEGLRKADGSPVEDLNDCTQIHPEDAGELLELLP